MQGTYGEHIAVRGRWTIAVKEINMLQYVLTLSLTWFRRETGGIAPRNVLQCLKDIINSVLKKSHTQPSGTTEVLEKVKEEQKYCNMGSCECPGKRRGSWEGGGNHHDSPYFSLPRHKEKASRNASKDESRNCSGDASVSLCNFIKHYKQGFIYACVKISSCPPFLWTNHFFW